MKKGWFQIQFRIWKSASERFDINVESYLLQVSDSDYACQKLGFQTTGDQWPSGQMVVWWLLECNEQLCALVSGWVTAQFELFFLWIYSTEHKLYLIFKFCSKEFCINLMNSMDRIAIQLLCYFWSPFLFVWQESICNIILARVSILPSDSYCMGYEYWE